MPDLLDAVARALGYLVMVAVPVGVLGVALNDLANRYVQGPKPAAKPAQPIVRPDPVAWTGPELHQSDNGVDLNEWRKRG